MKMTFVSGAVVALVLAAAPMAGSASAAQTQSVSASVSNEAAAPSVATAQSRCRETHYYNGRYHRHSRLICTHNDNRRNRNGRFGNGHDRFDNNNGRFGNRHGRSFPRG